MSPASETGASHAALRWLAVALFVLTPWLVVHLLLLAPGLPTEMALKAEDFARRGAVDTVIAGDSRVLRISPEPFAARGWRYYNMGLSSMSPDDVSMALRYALEHASVRRVVLGASFESLTQSWPYEFSLYGERGYAPEPRPLWLEHLAEFPYALARPRLQLLLARIAGEDRPPLLLPDGRAAYVKLQREMAEGRYDVERGRGTAYYFDRADGPRAYLRSGVLGASAMKAYRDIVRMLEDRGVAVLIFETGRTREFQAQLDADPVLRALQEKWRAFFRSQEDRCVGFVAAADLRDAYRDGDFFDAVHFLGRTERLLGERLAGGLAVVESRCREGAVASP